MADLAERAEAVGLAFYEKTFPQAQTLSNLMTVGLFHLFEQHLFSVCDALAGQPGGAGVTSMQAALDWILARTGVSASAYASVARLNDLKNAANTIKHSEGHSAANLRNTRADLFVHPGGRGLVPEKLFVPEHAGRPLTGEGVYVTDGDYADFSNAVRTFWQSLEADFVARNL